MRCGSAHIVQKSDKKDIEMPVPLCYTEDIISIRYFTGCCVEYVKNIRIPVLFIMKCLCQGRHGYGDDREGRRGIEQ